MQAIKLITGATPTCFRPPFGDVDDRIRAISKGLGLTNILWKFDTFDTVAGPTGKVEDADIKKNYQEFIKLAKNGTFSKSGAILLAHETNNQTMQEAINFYPQLKSAFKHIVPITVAYNKTQPYAEKDFKFPDFAKYIATEPTKVQDGTSKGIVSTTVTPTSTSSMSTSRSSAINQANDNGATTTLATVKESQTAADNNVSGSKKNGAEALLGHSSTLVGPVVLAFVMLALASL
ncbi:hypothetical protein E1B28_005417 [Marasmius oreades]|uniref:chitin deacetylase n=1 Tax=Marasmius oreades TaxID=181124 RepID=A0A9P7UU83_9AGAR|nr:uncharacterized protein E1B28_005417 [Marasmius oreades]KAG7094592.1 hypothetical protein E1B28_005417 [Marasmius oreades]